MHMKSTSPADPTMGFRMGQCNQNLVNCKCDKDTHASTVEPSVPQVFCSFIIWNILLLGSMRTNRPLSIRNPWKESKYLLLTSGIKGDLNLPCEVMNNNWKLKMRKNVFFSRCSMEDSAEYSVEAKNPYGEAYSFATVLVRSKWNMFLWFYVFTFFRFFKIFSMLYITSQQHTALWKRQKEVSTL